MEVKVLEEKKNKAVFELEGDTTTIVNLLKSELWNDSQVKISGFQIAHPLVNVPKFVVETDGTEPRKAIISAIKRLDKTLAKLKEDAKKELK